jgi:sulfoquinovose isomerase
VALRLAHGVCAAYDRATDNVVIQWGDPEEGTIRHDIATDGRLAAEATRLIDFARRSVHPAGGFGWLDTDGSLRADRPHQLWINCRMTHVFALAALQGEPDGLKLVEHGVDALRGMFADRTHGGWFASVRPGSAQAPAGEPADTEKSAYDHAFVLLAAASAATVGARGADDLLADAIEVTGHRFWDEADGMVVEKWDRGWRTLEPYRGMNSNMHATEAFLAVHAVTGDPLWRERARRIVSRAFDLARANSWRMPEHFDADWRPQPGYNHDDPAHPFRPYGATVGHALEWSRLALHLRAAYGAPANGAPANGAPANGAPAPAFLLADAQSLFGAAVGDGWAVDGADGFVYTTDWDGRPVVRDRMHWVLAEAIAAAAALAATVDDPRYQRWQDILWAYAERHVIDREHGSWHHQLDQANRPAGTVWAGKPDVYHALQATLIGRTPLAAGVAAACAAGRHMDSTPGGRPPARRTAGGAR